MITKIVIINFREKKTKIFIDVFLQNADDERCLQKAYSISNN